MVVADVDDWVVVGGRRWARVVAGELCSQLSAESRIFIQASGEEAGFREWWRQFPFRDRLVRVEDLPPCVAPRNGVALIVNSACQHRVAMEQALDLGYHVVSEKPMTLSREESLEIIRRAELVGRTVFSTNTFLFADYLRVLKHEWLEGRELSELHLTWMDASSEVRDGGRKDYDSGVPIIYDILPHAATIWIALRGRAPIRAADLELRKGGSEVLAKFWCEGLTVTVLMARRAPCRVRRARLGGGDFELTLDFAVEPGEVTLGDGPSVCADREWQRKRRPIAAMIESVREFFRNEVRDERCGTEAALFGNELIDRVAVSYVRQQVEFLSAQAKLQPSMRGADFQYAARESMALAERVTSHLRRNSPLVALAEMSPGSRGCFPC